MPKFSTALLLSIVLVPLQAAPPAIPADPLNRLNPRSAVTAFLQACHQNDYAKAAQYLDLSRISLKQRAQQGPQLARDLESVLNSAAHFDVLQMSQSPQGNLNDDPDPNIEHVTTITSNDQKFPIDLERLQPANSPPIWVFSKATIAILPQVAPVPTTESRIEARLPRFLVSTELLETAIWKWLALLIAAGVLYAIFRLLVRLFSQLTHRRVRRVETVAWLPAIVDPLLVLVSVIVFRIFEAMVAPAALTRLYIGRALLLVVIASFAWGSINLLDFLIVRLDRRLNQRQRMVSYSLVYLVRRVLKTVIAVFAAMLILDNWGFHITTILAGLGVGGIAVALAAQQTIANVFGGVSVISDAPVMVGDSGSFGGVVGTIEDIGLRSARVRTLNRSVVSIPNSSFAGMNLENYAVRDKILFNPTFTVKRTTPRPQVLQLLNAIRDMLANKPDVEIGPKPARITAYSASAFTIEVFAYVLTTDMDEYYGHQADLYLALDELITSLNIELA